VTRQGKIGAITVDGSNPQGLKALKREQWNLADETAQ
jgi:hypothetical protein